MHYRQFITDLHRKFISTFVFSPGTWTHLDEFIKIILAIQLYKCIHDLLI